jgi:hypothetical protein
VSVAVRRFGNAVGGLECLCDTKCGEHTVTWRPIFSSQVRLNRRDVQRIMESIRQAVGEIGNCI